MKIQVKTPLSNANQKLFNTFFATFILASILDFIWHNIVLYRIYFDRMAAVARLHNTILYPILEISIMAYAAYTLLIIFIVKLAVKSYEPSRAALYGGIAGLATWGAHSALVYATYNGMHKDVFVIDTIWSFFLGMFIGWFSHRLLLKTFNSQMKIRV